MNAQFFYRSKEFFTWTTYTILVLSEKFYTQTKMAFKYQVLHFDSCPKKVLFRSKISVIQINIANIIFIENVERTQIEKKYCKKAINFPTDFSLAHCGKEISLKEV